MKLKVLIDFHNNKSRWNIKDVIRVIQSNNITHLHIQSLYDDDKIIIFKYLKLFGEIKIYEFYNNVKIKYTPYSKS